MKITRLAPPAHSIVFSEMEHAKKTVSASNKAARRALMADPTAALPDIAEEQIMQQNIDAEMKDMHTAERERNVFACQCLNVPMVIEDVI